MMEPMGILLYMVGLSQEKNPREWGKSGCLLHTKRNPKATCPQGLSLPFFQSAVPRHGITSHNSHTSRDNHGRRTRLEAVGAQLADHRLRASGLPPRTVGLLHPRGSHSPLLPVREMCPCSRPTPRFDLVVSRSSERQNSLAPLVPRFSSLVRSFWVSNSFHLSICLLYYALGCVCPSV